MLTSVAPTMSSFLKLSFLLPFISQETWLKFSDFYKLGSYQERSAVRLVIALWRMMALGSPDELETYQNQVPTVCTSSEYCPFCKVAETLTQLSGKCHTLSVNCFYKVFFKTGRVKHITKLLKFSRKATAVFFHIHDLCVTETKTHLSTSYIFIYSVLCVFSELVVS